jgi:hypothetical protein
MESELDEPAFCALKLAQLTRSEHAAQLEAVGALGEVSDDATCLCTQLAHDVLTPILRAITETTPKAVAPRLEQIRDRFLAPLARARDLANEIFDEERHEDKPEPIPTVKVDLRLHGRELETPAQLEALLKEIEARLAPLVGEEKRVRLR